MPVIEIEENQRSILEGNGFAHLATIGPTGAPQVSPTWYLWDDKRGELLISLTQTRQKYRNLVRTPQAAVSIADPKQPYSYIEMRGPVTIEVDEDHRLIDALAHKYVGKERYSRHQPGEVRVAVRLTPTRLQYVFAG